MTIIDEYYDKLLTIVARRGRTLLAVQSLRTLCHLGDVFLRIAAINWCFMRLSIKPVVIPLMPVCVFIIVQMIMQAAIAVCETASATVGKQFDDQCMNDVLNVTYTANPKTRSANNLNEQLSNYRFNIAYIGSVSRNVAYVFDFASFACSMVAYICVLAWLLYGIYLTNPWRGLITLIVAIIALIWCAMVIVHKHASDDEADIFSNILRTERQRRYYIFDLIYRYPIHAVLNTFHAEDFVKKQYRMLNDRGLQENIDYMTGLYEGQQRMLVRQVVLFVVMIGTLAVAAIDRPDALYMLPMAVGISVQAMTSGVQAMTAHRQIKRIAPHLRNVVTMLAPESPTTSVSTHNYKSDNQTSVCEHVHSVDFDHVWFVYPESDEYVLQDITLHLDINNSVIALVGLNGAGKSTMIGLISGKLQPTRGRILIDGVDLQDRGADGVDNVVAHLRSVGVLSQDQHLFSGTIRDNILSGTALPSTMSTDVFSDRCNDTVEHLLHKVGADGLLPRIDRHVESLEDDNITLSGGERQRVALARVLALPQRRLYLFDEPTSAFDPEARRKFFLGLHDMVHGVGTIVVTHDVRSCAYVDCIVVVDHGRIVEQGSFDELRAAHGPFAALYEQQCRNQQSSR